MSGSNSDLINALSGGGVLGAIAHPAQINLLADYGSAANTADAIWRARQWQAKQAAGTAQLGGIDPATGVFSASRANQGMGPDTALAAPETLESSQRLGTAGQDQAAQMNKLIADGLAPLINPALTPDGALHDAVGGLSARLIAAGADPARVSSVLAKLPNDPGPLRVAMERIRQSVLPPDQQQHAIYGRPMLPDVGSGYQPGMQNQQTGAYTNAPGAAVGRNLTPGEKTSTQEAIDPNTGAKGTVPIGEKYNPDGSLKPPGWGRNNGGYTSGTPAIQPPAGFTQTELPPGIAEAQRKSAEASTDAGTQIYKQADAATGMKSQLLTMEQDLAKISTGPASERLAMLNALTQKLGIGGITMTADELAGSEAFAKVAKQIALAQAGALGVGTDEKLTTSLGANPNRDLSKMGNQQIIAMLQGNADAIKARGVAYDEWKKTHTGADTNSFLTAFNKTFDPRVYQWGYQIRNMTAEQRNAAYNALPDKEQFRTKYNDAVKRGLIDPYAN